jgi:hypothetical protein
MSRITRIEKALQKAFTRLNNEVSISTPIPGTANRYGDIKGASWSNPISFYAQLKSTGIESQLEDSGWHTQLGAVTVYVPVLELQRVGLATSIGQPTFSRGARLIVNGDTYEIRDIEDNQTVFDSSALFIVIYGMRGVS